MSKLCLRFVFLNRNRTCNVTISACVDFFILVKLLDICIISGTKLAEMQTYEWIPLQVTRYISNNILF